MTATDILTDTLDELDIPHLPTDTPLGWQVDPDGTTRYNPDLLNAAYERLGDDPDYLWGGATFLDAVILVAVNVAGGATPAASLDNIPIESAIMLFAAASLMRSADNQANIPPDPHWAIELGLTVEQCLE